MLKSLFHPPAPPTARRLAELVTGNYLQFLSSVLVLCGGMAAFVMQHRGDSAGVMLAELAAAAGGVTYFLAPMRFNTAWVTVRGPRSPEAARRLLLYLRPFELDARMLLQLSVGASCGPAVGAILWLQPLFAFPWPLWVIFCTLPLGIRVGEEQGLQNGFGSFGRLITFSQPQRRLQPIGAWRYQASGQWKDEATSYMREARLVIFRPGSSPSIEWELHQLLDTVPAERILIYLRFRGSAERRQRAWEAFGSQVRAHIPANLPPTPGRARYLLIDGHGNARLFTPDNRPAALLRQLFSGDFDCERLRPVLEALGDGFRMEPATGLRRFTRLIWQPLWVNVAIALIVGFGAALVLTALIVALVLAR
ncbi:MAG TPA: hypothetical protein VHG93_07830 [Longimicrobium sp.]|nr:hypothetical protein [Longimicrobium sp.]